MAQATSDSGEALDIGNQRQLMLDPHLAVEFAGEARRIRGGQSNYS